MSDSFGEGYATRCEEEGFGGIYGSIQSFTKCNIDDVNQDKTVVHEDHPGMTTTL